MKLRFVSMLAVTSALAIGTWVAAQTASDADAAESSPTDLLSAATIHSGVMQSRLFTR